MPNPANLETIENNSSEDESDMQVEQEGQDRPEEEDYIESHDGIKTIFDGQGLTITSYPESDKVLYRNDDGDLVMSTDADTWTADFTPFGKTESTPRVKSASLIMLYDDLKDFFELVDTEEIDAPDMIKGHTNKQMAKVAERLGFESVNATLSEEAKKWSREDFAEIVDDSEIKAFFQNFLGELFDISLDNEGGQDQAGQRFVKLYNNLSSDQRKTLDDLFCLLPKRQEISREFRRWIDSKIKQLDDEKKVQIRGFLKEIAETLGDSNGSELTAKLDDIREATQRLEQRDLSSGEKFIEALRKRAESNKPDPVDERWGIV